MATSDQTSESSFDSGMRARTGETPFIRALTGPVARIVFALPFLMFGLMHFVMSERMAGVVPEGIPGTYFWVYLTGVAHIAASTAIATKWMIRPAGILLAVMLMSFVLTVHLPVVIGGGQAAAGAMTNLLKDTALAGGALMAAHFASHR